MKKRKPTLLSHQITDQSITIQMQVDDDILDFQGHFKGFPILPGVTQIDWAIYYAREYLNVPESFKGMEVIKFQEPILPNANVTLSLDWDENKQKLAFRYSSEEGSITHASGKMKLGHKGE
ncbi:3-hydroxyacyl-ACP dehydratase [Vibrio sp. T187]|uniref:3-hydroxyacyl-ACP dehydratase FabZ family protein n=1 Tax=Vibrio TaxID=662 RepID=UPI0010C9FE7C|nr:MULTISPECIES: 3-hydroxyacyl-ACP dehydratase [Vibrio]MBW3696324.1 3-hydroxyacyl-ACP dehydratase [Vibrio sp. T187]